MSNENINLIILCPHCESYIEIEQLNCRIFRHGIFRATGKQIDPHSSKEKCDYYVANSLIYGCGKPFMIERSGDEYLPSICNYI
jgi:hypothetical protein